MVVLMKFVLTVLLMMLSATVIRAQETGNDSYTIQRLIVFNDAGQVLLEKNDFGWMTPALRHNTQTSINDGIKNLAAEFGLDVTRPKLAAIFMFMTDYKPKSQFRQHYIAERIDGQLKVPENKRDAQWFTISKAIEMMSLPDTKAPLVIRDMTQQILNYPAVIWGGTYMLSKENDVISYRITENFYPLH